MKIKFLTLLSLFAASSILMTACKKEDDETTIARAASFSIGNATYTVSKPYLGVFNDNGTLKNTMTLTATDGSKVEFYFEGSSPATYPLQSFSNGYYINAAGRQYNSTSGELIITDFTIDGAIYKATGTFQFKAKAIVAPIDSLEITLGVFTNASNEL